MQLASAGDLLATVDAVEYRAIQLVFAWAAGGVPAIYCPYADWTTTPAAKLADKERQIIELSETLERWAAETLAQTQRASAAEARVQELERQLAAPSPPPIAHAGVNGGVELRIACDHCGKRIWPSLMEKHIAEKHPPAPAAPIQLLADSSAWRCAAKGCSGAFTRDLRDPAFCAHHAQPNTNGHLAATDVEVAK